MLTDIIPAEWRKRVYAVYAALASLITVAEAVYLATQTPQPTWLVASAAAVVAIGAAIGSVAKANVNPPAVPQHAIVEPSATANADGTVTSVTADGTVTKV
jgi:hypothetical protein